MLIDWDPYLKCVVCVLSIDLIQIQAIVHALLHSCDVLVVANFEPMVEHWLDPTLTVKQVEADLTSQELGHEEVSLPLQIIDDVRIHLL